MRTPVYTKRFEKDLALAKKRGKDIAKLKEILGLIISEEPLSFRLREHRLIGGKYVDRRECHIEPDWLLVYKLDPGSVVFERTGTHSDLF